MLRELASPDRAGTQVVVFVRQPVTYVIARPSVTGAIEVTMRARTVPAPSPAVAGARRPAPAKPAEGSDQVAVDAAELAYDQEGDVLIARGGVTLTRGDTTLRADEVRYDRRNSVAEAHGHVPTEAVVRTTVRALERPQFSYAVHVADDQQGDGDGRIEPGERGSVWLSVKNVGAGRTYRTIANLRNESGRGVLLREGRPRAAVVPEDNDGPSDREIGEAVSRLTGQSVEVHGSNWFQAYGPLQDLPDGVYVVNLRPVESDRKL